MTTAIAPAKRPTPRSLPRLARSQLIELQALARAEGAPADEERFGIAISSEYPVERANWGTPFIEILDHGKSSVDLKRLRDGGALLVDHDTRDHVGVLEEARIDEDRVLRGVIRFGQSVRAREIRQDVLDGIRRHISIGYRVQRMKRENTAEGELETYRVTRWEPLEVSIVAVPADPSVGLGRSSEDGALQLDLEDEAVAPAPDKAAPEEERMENQPAAPAGAAVTVADRPTGPDAKQIRGEAAEIVRLCTEHGVADRAAGYLAEGKTLSEVGLLILADKRQAAGATHVEAETTWDALTPKEQQRFRLTRAIMASATGNWKDAGFEREVSEAEAKRTGRPIENNRLVIPSNISLLPQSRGAQTLVTGTASVGGNIVFTEVGSFIELLRNKMVCAQAGATILTGLTAPITFPTQLVAATLSWPAEAAGSDVTATHPTFGQLKLSGFSAQAMVPYSKQLLMQSSPSVDDLVRRDLAMVHAIGIDNAALNGTGSAQPTGILTYSGVGAVTMGTNGGAPTYAKIVEIETTLATSNADVGALKWVTNPKVRGKLRQVEQFASTNGMPVWAQDNSMLGYGALVTNQVPSNLTKGTSTTVCSAIVFGNWNDLIIGEFGAFEILTDPYVLAGQGVIRLISYQLVDVGIRHAASFVALQDATT